MNFFKFEDTFRILFMMNFTTDMVFIIENDYLIQLLSI